MAEATIGHDHVVAEDSLEGRADPEQRGARLLVERIGLELDPVRAEPLEAMLELEELGLAVRSGALGGGRDPRPADLEPTVLRHDAQEARAADRAARGALHGRERDLDPCIGVGERGLQPCLEASSIDRPGECPLPQARVERDLGQPVQVVAAQRLEAHDATFEHDRLDPSRVGHGLGW